MKKNKLTYKEAGVDIDAGNNLIQNIKPFIKDTLRPEVLSDIGGFGAIVEISKKYQNPVLVSGTDGVGTKLKLAIEWNMHKTIGFDLVAMSVNDILVQGAEPLFFLDYFACGKLDINLATEVIKGIALACKESNCSLIGGETAEMPGMYPIGDYDLAGFAVGIAEKDKIITGKNIKENDIIIGIPSNGAHSNGYSLIRKIIELTKPDLNQIFDNDKTLKEIIISPTKLYVKTILNLLKNINIKGIAHITGGGIIENIPRVVPKDLQVVIDTSSWTFPKLFSWLQDKGNLSKEECLRTFNCGIGMVIIVDKNDKDKVLDTLKKENEIGYVIGHITYRKDTSNIISLI